ncbi:hypothetical protein A3L11_05560 [Thermococcus siculi]|uniref:Zinc-binding protein n=1 Tax=Thermococcus siculi TaxID=72803 RepID=A0A2Z2MJX1_9EURY|nr:putative zinc-binding protein [Thermococcus siculi]ASJ08722.1 hypothetical protein A3L11_05560 [Thermococcus siculi]
MTDPEVCLITCGESLSELIAVEALKELGDAAVLCPLTAITRGVPEVIERMKAARYVVLIDSCSLRCAKKTADELGIHYDEYINLEEELNIKTPCYENPSVEAVDDIGLGATHLVERIGELLSD